MATSQAYSDLIHLFLDGEATETERSVLFGALKDSPALQEEFASAVQVRGALVSDAMKLQPPAYLEGQIIEKAGLLASKLSVGSVASSALTTAPTAATPFLLKAGLLIVIGAAAGVATLVGIQNSSTPSKLTNSATARTATERIRPDLTTLATPSAPTQNVASPSASQAVTADSHVSSVSPAHPVPNASIAGSTHRSISNQNASSATSLHDHASNMNATATTPVATKNHTSTHSQRTSITSNPNGVKDMATKDHGRTNTQDLPKKATHIPASNEPVNFKPDVADRANSAVQPVVTPAIAESQREITPASVIASNIGHQDIIIGDRSSERNPLRANEFTSDGSNWLSSISIQLSGIFTGAEYPYPEEVPGRDNADIRQVAIGVGYDVTPEFRFGLSGGRESFAIYKRTGDEYAPSHSILWMAATARYIFNDIPGLRDANVGVYIQGSAGGATFGPMFKFEPGIEFAAAPNVKIGVGGSYIGMFFQHESNWYGTGKTDLNLSATWHF
jgi:anti-sigma factor RsiW